jgi:hypothetical protein
MRGAGSAKSAEVGAKVIRIAEHGIKLAEPGAERPQNRRTGNVVSTSGR